MMGRPRGFWIARYGGRVPTETYGADVGDQIHPPPKARIGDDHHNGAGGEAKSEPLGPTCSGGLTPPSQADHRPEAPR